MKRISESNEHGRNVKPRTDDANTQPTIVPPPPIPAHFASQGLPVQPAVAPTQNIPLQSPNISPTIQPSNLTDAEKSLLNSATTGDLKTLCKLIDEKVNINIADEKGMTALLHAAKNGHTDIVVWLNYKGAKMDVFMNVGGAYAIHLATFGNHFASIVALIRMDADVNAKDGRNYTPLHLAAEYGFKKAAEVLVANKADLNVKNAEGLTPLHTAAQYGQREVAEILVANKADANVKDVRDFTPLHVSAVYGQRKVAELLIANKADVNTKGVHGLTPLHTAANFGQREVAELLIANKADVNTKTMQGAKPLHFAIQKGYKDIVELLVKKGTILTEQLEQKVMEVLSISKDQLDKLAKQPETPQHRAETWVSRVYPESQSEIALEAVIIKDLGSSNSWCDL